ncbi:unnamed protein product [Heligmosomoides polygyrus]|uniref:AA_permease domain-containing protein n=1 Tax=Heligmosomoides polygyrus TaxID=6339 RepID=A0A3P8AXC5_HELPZ|nr:unnamed protein product [Heligmosomoides polygyrus]
MAGSVWAPGKLALAFYGGLWSYAGWDILNYGTPEIAKPTRWVKDFAQKTLGNFSYAIPFMVALLLIGTLNSNIFCGSRFMYAAAREGHLPTFISCVHEPSFSPRAALLGQMLCTFAVSFVDIETLINYVTFVMWAQKAVTVSALLYIRYSKMPVAESAIRVPIALTVLFLVISVALVLVPFIEEPLVTLTGVAVVASGLIFFYALVRPKEAPRILQVINDKMTRFTCRLLFCRPDVKKSIKEVAKNSDELRGLDS